ncbi:hypothetical protein ABTB45_16580 [Acinetobacter baumannii]|uniref:hypothetical protein n=1 Tax=Acinetobacter baumannii TaxID=470 RepID=UPI002340C9C1|nr:hypothetical protein [Acinetobacter baumannii]MDC5065225.1 hypothetical protein [Acinetobacter baumannii]HCJ0470774.1 hypothetical protein [Acinetobacter baumannii]
METLSVWEAALFLERELPKRDARGWYGYLKQNPRKYLEQDGYKIVCHVIDGRQVYTDAALKAFVKAHKKLKGAKNDRGPSKKRKNSQSSSRAQHANSV